MFTGIVEHCGRIAHRETGTVHRLGIDAGDLAGSLKPGASLAVNGACLTVNARAGSVVFVDVVPETRRRTNLADLAVGDAVNLERAARLGDPVDGHLVTGHVDGVGRLLRVDAHGEERWLTVEAPAVVADYLVPKGSVALDGISLTVVAVQGQAFTVTIVPHTWRVTNLSRRRTGDRLNVEADLVGKYVRRFVTAYLSKDRRPR